LLRLVVSQHSIEKFRAQSERYVAGEGRVGRQQLFGAMWGGEPFLAVIWQNKSDFAGGTPSHHFTVTHKTPLMSSSDSSEIFS